MKSSLHWLSCFLESTFTGSSTYGVSCTILNRCTGELRTVSNSLLVLDLYIMKYNYVYLVLLLLSFCCGCLPNDDYQDVVNEVNACADPSKIETTEVDPETDKNFFIGQLAEEDIRVKTGFLDYFTRVARTYVVITPGPNASSNVARSYNQPTLRLTRAIASENSPQGNHLFSLQIRLPCSENTEEDGLTFFKNALEEGRSYPISDGLGNCEEEIDITIRILCYSYEFGRDGHYTSSPLSTENGRQTGRSFTVEKYEVTETPEGNIHVKLRANFSANLYTATSVGVLNFGALEGATIDFDVDVD